MLTITDWQDLSLEEKQQILARPAQSNACKQKVEDIINAVKTYGDEALFAFTREFDSVNLAKLKVPVEALISAEMNSDFLTVRAERSMQMR
jgi:histidinol dehydrogenase